MSELTVKEMQEFIREEVRRSTETLLNSLSAQSTKKIYGVLTKPDEKDNERFGVIHTSSVTTEVESSIFGNVVPGVFTKDPEELCDFDRAIIHSILGEQ